MMVRIKNAKFRSGDGRIEFKTKKDEEDFAKENGFNLKESYCKMLLKRQNLPISQETIELKKTQLVLYNLRKLIKKKEEEEIK